MYIDVHKFGRNPDIDSGGVETIWSPGGLLTWPTSAGIVTLVSTSAQDNPSGTGCGYVWVEGLDANYIHLRERVPLNGTTNVTTTNEFLRVHRLQGDDPGSTSTTYENAGVITATLGGNTIASIEANKGQSQLGFYTVAAGHTLKIALIHVTSFKLTTTSAFEVEMFIRNQGKVWNLKGTWGGHSTGAPPPRPYVPPIIVPEKSDIEFRGAASANNTGVSVEFCGNLYQNTIAS